MAELLFWPALLLYGEAAFGYFGYVRRAGAAWGGALARDGRPARFPRGPVLGSCADARPRRRPRAAVRRRQARRRRRRGHRGHLDRVVRVSRAARRSRLVRTPRGLRRACRIRAR